MLRNTRFLVALLGLALLLVPASAMASHNRGGSISWTNPSGNTVNFTVISSWRQAFGSSTESFAFGDGGSTTVGTNGTNLGSFTDANGLQYWTWQNTPTRNYGGQGPYTTSWGSCCRISQVSSQGSNYRVESIVDMRSGNNASPSVGAPSIIQMVRGAQNTYTLPVVEADGQSWSCQFSTSSQSGINAPSWLSLSNNCVLSGTAPTSGAALWAYSVRVTDSGGAVTTFDGLIQMITGSPPTCTGGGSFNTTVGVPFSTSFTGTNPTGGNLTVQLLSGPPGSSLSPASGSTGSSPYNTTFNWTPSSSDFGASYSASVIYTNSQNLQASCGLGLTVPFNQAPTAEANGTYTGSKGSAVAVTASGSSDPDGTITLYEWDCDGNGTYEVSTTSVTASCPAFSLGGSYTITLRVTDDQGSTDTDTATINVPNVGPNAEANGPYTVNQGVSVTVTGAGSTDGDGGTLTYAWDCNTANGTSYSSGSITQSCVYPDDGTYFGSLQVCDPEGACDTDSFQVNVTNTAPVANAGGPYNTVQGTPAAVSGSASSDPDGTIASYEWDCDASDGISYSAPSTSSTSTCVWPDDGTYTVTLRVTDDDGATDTDTATATVTNTVPIADAGGPYSGQKNSNITVTGAASNDPDGSIVLYQWDCDASDGVAFNTGSTSPTLNCVYASIGNYTVTLQVTDDDGATDTDTATVAIINADPTANPGGPYSAFQNTPVVLDGSASSDPDGFLVSYEWDCNTGNGISYSAPSTSPLFNCTYNLTGTFTVSLRVTDDDGATDVGTTTVAITNQSPIAEAGGPYNGNQGAAMPVFAFGSSDPDGSLVSYEWDCDNNGSYEITATSPTGSSCFFSTIGTYTINLRVTDDDGATATDSATALIGNQDPVAAPGGPYAGLQGQNVLVDGSQSTDVDGTIVDFSWDCDAGNGINLTSTGTTPVFACSYATVGTYTVTLIVTDDDGATNTATTQVVVSNGSPVAVAGGPYTGVKNVPVTVDASASTDADGTIVSYAWDCDTDGVVDVTTTTPTAACIYSNIGTYTVTLTVTDNDGSTSTDTGTVNIPAVDPVADAGGPYAGTQGIPVALDASASSDADGNIVTYEWDCEGDGIFEFSSFNPNDVTCTYTVVGVYTLVLQVTDDDGLTDTDTAVVTLANILPVADAGGPYTGTEGTSIAVDGTGSGDIDGSIVQYSWDCDSDGLPDAISPLPFGASCTYAASGSYTVTLTVTDNDGAVDTDTASVTVLSTPPTAVAGGPYTGGEGSLILLDGSGSSDTGGSIVLYEWDCNSDGVVDASSTQPLGQGCSYEDEGNFTVTLTVTDDDGDSSVSVATVAVANVAPTLVGPSGPTTGVEGSSLNWSATATDPGVNDVLTYSWDFGDGDSDTGPSVNHVYAEDGTYTVTVTVDDGDGGTDVNTITVVISNAAPQFNVATIPNLADEGQQLTFTASASDAGSTDVLTFTWDFGDGGTETGDNVVYTYVDDGTFTVTVTVTDDDGGSDVTTAQIVVNNVAPVITLMSGDLAGNEGDLLTWEAAATDVGVLDVLTYSWDFGDGNTATGQNVSNIFTNEGQYVVQLTVDDGDGGVTTQNLTVVISNLAPVVTSNNTPGGDEGVALNWSAAAQDAGAGDTITYSWDFGDGTFASGDTVTKTYTDDGTFTVIISAMDDAGATGIQTVEVTINNVAPVITSLTAVPLSPDEGSEIDLVSTATDQGADDIPDLTYTWDFGDGTPNETGPAAEHTWADDGTFTVTLTVDDQDGGVTTQTIDIIVNNVAPVISSSPPVNALEDSLYTYQPTVQDPGDEVFTWSISSSAPPSMTIDPLTGLIEWTPDYNDYLVGQYSLTLTVDDGDGGIDQQSWTITVFSDDTDGDGIPDDWELANGLDPNDPTDAGNDPDGDGITNFGEFTLDQDPFTYDGPSEPILISPIGGIEVTEPSPDLVVENAIDPQNETLLYDFQVYEDEFMLNLVTETYEVIEGSSGETTWKVDVQLVEDQTYYWRARAADQWTPGEWTDLESFVLNEFNDAAGIPELIYPVDGEVVTVLQPTVQWTQVEDPNGDDITYDVVVYEEDGATVAAEVFGVPDSGNATTTWTVDVELVDDSDYWWTARAVDDEGLAGDWAEAEPFFLTTENGAPDQPVFIDPEDGDIIEPVSPTLTATEVEDPEGGEVSYEFEIDQVSSFDSIDYRMGTVPGTETGTVWWDLEAAGIELDENAWAWARVRAVDELGIASAPDTITFYVRGENDVPPTPTLLRPEDESTVPGVDVALVLANVDDIEEDDVFYDFLLATDPELTEVVFTSDNVPEGIGPDSGEGETSVLVPETLLGEYWFTARAVDEFGAASEWAEPFMFVATGDQDTGPFVDPDSFIAGAGCRACAGSVSPMEEPATWWLVGLVPVALIARRRRSASRVRATNGSETRRSLVDHVLRFVLILGTLAMLSAPASAFASHFRGGTITWTRPSSSTNASFVINHSWRVNAVNNVRLYYGDGGNSGNLSYTSLGTFTDSTGLGYTAVQSTTSRNYSGNGPYTAYFSSCCRIGQLSNGANGSFRVESVVNMNGGNTASPAVGTAALLQMVRGAQNTVQLAIVDPDLSSSATCGWSSSTQAGTGGLPPSWLSIDSNTCVMSGTPPASGNLWAYSVRVTDNNGAVTTFDGMIEIVTGSPPVCTGGGNFNATVGQQFSTSFTGTNAAGGTLTFQTQSAPSGSTLSPTSGSSGTTSTFTWTPTAADFGQSYAATVIVTNSQGLQDTCPLGLTIPINTAPNAEANGSYSGGKSVGIPVTAVGSSDSDGTITTYEWDCDGNGSYEVVTSSVGATCGPFTLGGTYNVTLRVTDDQGSTDTDTTTITISNVGPSANAGGPYTVNQGVPVTISGAGSTDGDGGSLSYSWDCDTANGTNYVAGSSTTSCTYGDDGTYTGSVQVCDAEGACDTDTFTVTVTNTAPTANAGGPYTTGQGVAVTVNGSSSSDPDGSISTYQWDCDTSDGLQYSAASSSSSFSCVWPDDGTYTLSLLVTDDDGATATDTATATVTNTSPIANAGGPYTGQKNTQITVTGAASTDPDGTLSLYQWDCDASDGVSLSVGSSSPTNSCSYPSIGTYTVTLQVTDDDGATDTDTATVTISNVAPNANAGGPYSVIQGTLVTLDGSQSSDPDGSLVSYEWDCDTSNGTQYSAPSTSATFGCTYAQQGTYTASLRVTDDDGATDVATATVVVTNQPPVAEAGGPYNGNQGVAMPVFAFGSNDPDGSLVSYEWDCDNNGTYEVTTTSPTGTTCTFSTIGTYTINLQVTDDDGATATDSATALIGNQDPVAAPGGPYAALQGQVVTVDGSASADTDGTLVDFEWDCDASNGVSYVSTGTTSSTTCTYATVGTYTITLRVTDDDGATDVETTTVLVSNGSPVANAGGPYTGVKNVAVTVDASGSSDPDGTIVSYAWDCDTDGVVDVTTTTPTAACIYTAIGTYTVTVTVTDNDGGTATDTGTVNIPAVDPVADAAGPYAGVQGVPVALDGSGSSDADGNIVTYEWDCEGDGVYEFTSFNSNDVTCTYSAVGTYTLQLQVTDDDGLTDTDTAVVTLTNIVPVADAGGPYTGTEAAAVAMDGTGSGDADGTVVSYSWDCESDGLPDAILPTPIGATCTYASSGSYTVTLTVTDDDGSVDSDTASVTIVSSPPTAVAGGPYSGDEGSLILLDGSGSSDAGGNIVSYQWDCTSDGVYDISATQPLGNGCLYEDEGNYTVTLQVTDDDGDSSVSVATIAVANVAPTLVGPSGPTTGGEGASLNWTAAATDPGVNDVLSYSWDFGDGESATGTSAAHVYAQDGTYNLTVTVTDGDGGSDTNTVQVVIGNLPPVLTVWTIPIASDEGQLLNFTAEATDPGVLDVLTYSWDFGDGSTGETGDIVNYAFADDGSYTISLTVTDDGGLTDTVTQTINVANVDPTITSMTGDLSGFEADVLSWSATATDPGVLDVLTYSWDFGDGNTATGQNVSNAYINEGQYVVTLTVTDGDGGIDIETLTVDVFNSAPSVDSFSMDDGDEGVALTYTVTASDAGVNDTLTYLWDFGDGTFAVGATATKTWDDDGSYIVTCTVTDDGGEFSSVSDDVVITNVAPVITSMVSLPDNFPEEGTSIDLEAMATDQGIADIPDLIYTWDFGDGSPTVTGSDTEVTYPDGPMTYTITLTVDDQDGGVVTQTLTIEVQNVDPIISTNPVVNANQGSLYEYEPQVVDPGDEVFTWSLSPSSPPAMTIDSATGVITWTPDYNDFLIGQHPVVLTVDDGDGGIDQQAWTITVFDTDSDGDGIPDDWEITNGLDPNDPTDAGDDPDGDGLTSLDEFGLDQDPNSYDGPSVPVAIEPIEGAEVTDVSPDLIFENATDPQSDTLLYDLQVFEDELMTVLVTEVYGVIEDSSGTTSWKVDVQLNEDQEYWWHVRAADPYVAGEWTDPENFVLNQFNDGPEAPELVYPIQGEIVTVLQPELEWTQVEDPNEDVVTYDIVIFAADQTTVILEAFEVPDSGNPTSTWEVDTPLIDDAAYWWTARAVDDEGLAGEWAELEEFFLTTENGAPDQPFFVDPLDGDQIEELSPVLTATEVEDPEGSEVEYEFEVDQVGTFDSTDYRMGTVPATDAGTVWWDLAAANIELDENAWAFARVRAIDEQGIASPPDTITFFVRGENDAPGTPTLLRPEDGATVPGLGVTLVLQNVEDLEDDLVFYDFILATDPEMTEVVFTADGVAEGVGPDSGEGETSVLVPQTLLGEYYWTARAIDDRGDASEWAEPFTFIATGDQDTGPFVDPDSFVAGAGCRACAGSVSPADEPATWWLVALLPVAMLWRRRRD